MPQEPRGASGKDSAGELFAFAKRAMIAAGVALAMLVVVGVLGYAFQVVLLAFAGVLLAVFLHGFAQIITRRTALPHYVAFALVSLVLVAGLVTAVYFLAADVAQRLDEFGRQLPQSYDYVEDQLRQYSWGDSAVRYLDQFRQSVFRDPPTETVKNIVLSALGGVGGVVAILFLGLYFGFEPRPYTEGVARLVPERHRGRAREIMGMMRDTLWNWLLGMVLMMVLVGVFTSVGLSLVGMPLPVTLGVIAALCAFVPNFGPIVGSIPGVLIAAPMGPLMVLKVIAVYVVAQVLESYAITPFIQRKMIKMPPALTVLSQVLMAVVAGVLGVLLAIPILASVMVLVKELYVRDTLGEDAEEPEAAIG